MQFMWHASMQKHGAAAAVTARAAEACCCCCCCCFQAQLPAACYHRHQASILHLPASAGCCHVPLVLSACFLLRAVLWRLPRQPAAAAARCCAAHLLQICQGHLEHAALQTLRGDLRQKTTQRRQDCPLARRLYLHMQPGFMSQKE